MSIDVRMITPEGVYWQGPCEMAVLPGSQGDVGILESHAHSIIQLRPGVARLYEKDTQKVSLEIFIKTGVAHISSNCEVLCEEILEMKREDLPNLETTANNLLEDIQLAEDPQKKMLLQRDHEVLYTLIRALKEEHHQ